jgi:hypothetical protein
MKTKKEIKRKKMEELTPKEMQSINGGDGVKYIYENGKLIKVVLTK